MSILSSFFSKKTFACILVLLLYSLLSSSPVRAELPTRDSGYLRPEASPDLTSAQRCCLCRYREEGFCTRLTGITNCEAFRSGPAFAQLTIAQSTHLQDVTCQEVTSNACDSPGQTLTPPGTTVSLQPSSPPRPLSCPRVFPTLGEGAEALSSTGDPQQTVAEATQAPFVSVVPQLGVQIPGLSFSSATQENGGVSVPFLAQYIAAVERYAIGLAVVAAVVMTVYGGLRYLLGAAVQDVAAGKQIITDALLGMLIALGGYLILNTVNPNVLDLKPLYLRQVRHLPISDEAASDSSGPDSLCRQTLIRTSRPGKRDVWCSVCGCGVMQTGIPDNACLALTGTCGGAYGQFLDALTGHCTGKTFKWLEGLDGGTFGILHYTENEFSGLIHKLEAKDPAAYARVLAAGGNAPLTNADICTSNQADQGFVCNTHYRAMLEAALRERSFTLVQLEDSYNKYLVRRRSAESHGFRSAFGQAMWATVANNPGTCNSPTEGLFYNVIAACPAFQGGSEPDKIECFLQKYVELGCRDGAPGAARRVQSIRQNLQNLSRTESAPLPTLTQLESCVPL